MPPANVATLVIAMPARLPILRDEARALLDWTARGGTLVLFFDGGGLATIFGRQGPAQFMQLDFERVLAERCNVSIRQTPFTGKRPSVPGAPAVPDVGPRPLVTVDASIPTAANAGAPHLAVEDVAPTIIPTGPGAVIPLYVGKGRPYGVEVPHSHGRVIIVTSAAPLQNARILESDNLAFVANLARLAADSGGIWFDEYHQGYAAPEGFGSVLGSHGFLGLVILICAAMLLFVVSRGRRFGPARPPMVYSRRHVLEYVRSVGGLYKRAASRSSAAQVLFRGLARRLRRSTGAVETRDSLGRPVFRGAYAEQMTNLASRASGAFATDTELLEIVKSMDELESQASGRDKE